MILFKITEIYKAQDENLPTKTISQGQILLITFSRYVHINAHIYICTYTKNINIFFFYK